MEIVKIKGKVVQENDWWYIVDDQGKTHDAADLLTGVDLLCPNDMLVEAGDIVEITVTVTKNEN